MARTAAPTPVYLPYDRLRTFVRNGDLLLWHPSSIAGKVIAWATRAPYSHASMAAWHGNRLFNVEMVQWKGGRRVHLSEQLKKFPKACEVWRPNGPCFDGDGAVHEMLWLVGQEYGWSDLARIAVHTVLPKFALPKAVDSDDPDVPRVCSASYHWAARIGGRITPCPGTPDLDVSPAMLAASGFASYIGTPVLSQCD